MGERELGELQPTSNTVSSDERKKCFHCGQPCGNEKLWVDEEHCFCCYGCKTVFEILRANDLCDYYQLDKNPGVGVKSLAGEYGYLDEPTVRAKVVEFDSPELARVTFVAPAIHCVSCVWLLENLRKIEPGILRSEVNFSRRTVTVDFKPADTALSRVADVLASLGYAPDINLDRSSSSPKSSSRSLPLKIAVAGFCFGNVMLFSFPEYLGLDREDAAFGHAFAWLNLLLSVPVLLFSGLDYFTSAWNSFRNRQINIDVPIAIGLIALFFRSAYDIVLSSGPGYFDSFTGLVFFLLVGRWFQGMTYERLSFDRDFKSYFPLAVNRKEGDTWAPVVVHDLKKDDTIRIRNMEIIPADSILIGEGAFVDYSFVTGESKPVHAAQGELVYAGGRLVGQPAVLVVQKPTSQSHLTSLWNSDAFKKARESGYRRTMDRAARVFTWVVLVIAIGTALWWQFHDPQRMWLVVTSVLMVACPCALALSAPFTYGSTVRVFGRNGLFLKNANVVERMASVEAVVFDKTGTVTHGDRPEVSFFGTLTPAEINAVGLLAAASTHPLSAAIGRYVAADLTVPIESFIEIPAKGIEGIVGGDTFRIGNATFAGAANTETRESSRVYVAVNGVPRGYFSIKISLRSGIKEMLDRLPGSCITLLSGDNDSERDAMRELFPSSTQLLFGQGPHDKLRFVKELQQGGKTVMMLGDGLNDSGALKQSDVGIAVTDDTGFFTPACDGILEGGRVNVLDRFLWLAKRSMVILRMAFFISFCYNAVAITIAATGHLTPLIAAVLMPLSSISVVSFSTLAVNLAATRGLGPQTKNDNHVPVGR